MFRQLGGELEQQIQYLLTVKNNIVHIHGCSSVFRS